MPTRSRNPSTSASSGVPINVDEPIIAPAAQDLTQLVQENMVAVLAPSDVDSRNVNFNLITDTTIVLHESPVSSDVNNLFDTPNVGPTNSSVFQLQSSDQVDSRNLVFQQSSSNTLSPILQSNISGNDEMIYSTSLVSQPISSSQSFQNIDATNVAFQQSSVMGAPGTLTSTVTPASNISNVDWARTANSSSSQSSSMPSLISASASDTSTVNRLTDQNTSAISNIVGHLPSATTLTPETLSLFEVIIPPAAAGSPAYSEVIFNVQGEKHW